MGYYSDAGLALTVNGIAELNKRLANMQSDSKIGQAVLGFLEGAEQHHTDTESGAQVWLWKCLKWYTDDPEYYPEIDFLNTFMGLLEDADFYFVRIGEDYDDIEIRGYFWENPFNLKLMRGITLRASH